MNINKYVEEQYRKIEIFFSLLNESQEKIRMLENKVNIIESFLIETNDS